mgnify:CR=1 FL=1
MKKIMMVAISIAVIFGFAACENTPILPYGNEVISVTLASAPDYLVGETVNPADIQLRVVYDDNTTKTFTGAELGLKYAGKKTSFIIGSDVTANNTFEVVYGADKVDGSKKEAWPITIPATSLDDVTILINPAAAKQTLVIAGVDDVTTVEGLAYSVEFPNGNIKAIDPATLSTQFVTKWPIDADSFVVKAYAAGAETTTIELADSVDNAELTADWTVDVVDVDDISIADAISDVKLEYNAETKEIFEHVKSGAETKLSEVDYNIVITLNQSFIDEYMNLLPEEAQTQLKGIKNPVTIAKDAAEEAEVEVAFTKYDAERTNVQKYGEGPYYATVTIGTGDSAYVKKDVPLTITFADDYPIEIKVEKVDQDTTAVGFQEKEYSAPGKVDAGDFNYTIVKWASDFTYTEEIKAPYETVGSSDITIENANILKGETGNHTVGFEYAHKTKTPVTIKFGDTSAATTTVKIASAE